MTLQKETHLGKKYQETFTWFRIKVKLRRLTITQKEWMLYIQSMLSGYIHPLLLGGGKYMTPTITERLR